jgi:two-component system response regulator PilR (NtrC family)
MIHDQGPRATRAFVPVNCGAIPQELMESELFGHRKGSFTGAVQDKMGLFQAAQGGTLFLDEVAELPLDMQVKLLRAIQERSVRPVGAEEEMPVDVRILSASHKNLAERVRSGAFREDLYYRLDVITLRIPPLRDRREDIPQLAEHVLRRLTREHAGSAPGLGASAMRVLETYDFPGNVRELENILERAMTLCEREEIGPEDLGISVAPSAGDAALAAQGDLDGVLEDVEKQRIVSALEQSRWNKTRAAKLLGISFGALRYRMQKLGLD